MMDMGSLTYAAGIGIQNALIKAVLHNNEWEAFQVDYDNSDNCIVAQAFDGWKTAKVRIRGFERMNIDDVIAGLKADFKRQWREGAMRGVKS